ncbi:helix-turn-helix transcriptional regulator [Simiduia sp. 21SJ11W-1]|uniref:helix-turn-helix transcriptional regulator n=1 Tax=Simiduia sp. 21SJ11W-1 TaxID=2909669 RepID=UPI0020A07208|nr:helix-turn-helix transcriptional regulator [Simiduia sp. 21SJ11W-1]UTA46982.1 helix-turn-helix transcriptional regulator [Simiduia sp. 21SJ11W-1]
MTLHTQALEVWNREIATAVACLGSPDFYAALVDALSATLPVDYPQVWRYTDSEPEPCVLFHRLSGAQRKQQVDDYQAGLYRKDPFYQLTHNGDMEAGFSHWRAAVEDAGRGPHDGMDVCDEVVFVAHIDDHTHIHLCLMRARQAPPFSAAELALLNACSPMVTQLISQHVKVFEQPKPGVEAGVRQAVALFGRSLLTAREQDVLGLMLSGYSTRFAADKLGISTETLRRHRKNIYQKLDVSSQTEVFSLFINSLGCFDAAPGQDPLRGYFGRQGAAG